MKFTPAALACVLSLWPVSGFAQSAPPAEAPPALDTRLYEVATAPSADRLEHDIRTLAEFGTRNTFSDTTSQTRGIGAARRWIFREFQKISEACGGCLEIYEQRTLVPGSGNARIPRDVYIVNVYAIQRGTAHPNRYVIMSGDIDSRPSNGTDGESDSPGANDNASGMAGVLEAARVLSNYQFGQSILYAGLSGEEQGLFGGQHLADKAVAEGWEITGVLNNDMISNTTGITGISDSFTFRVFSEPTSYTETDRQRGMRRFTGGEVDGPSRQLARYVARMADLYFPTLEARMIYRLDRFGRGGHHRPFNDRGFAGVRIMERRENYNRQHQNVRVENGIAYGDVMEGVNPDYAASLTGINAVTLAALASAPPAPDTVRIGGAVSASTTLAWSPVEDPNLAGYVVLWRDTTAPQWTNRRYVGNVTRFTLENVVIDDYFFGVAAVGKDGNESLVVFPTEMMR